MAELLLTGLRSSALCMLSDAAEDNFQGLAAASRRVRILRCLPDCVAEKVVEIDIDNHLVLHVIKASFAIFGSLVRQAR